MEAARARIIAAVDQLILEQGELIPVELLLRLARMPYARYEAWRCGEERYLEDAVAGSPERIVDQIHTAAIWAADLGLKPHEETYRGWGGHSSIDLALSRSPDTDRLLRTHFRRDPRAAPQMDLFLDGSATAIINDLVEALAGRDPVQADRHLDTLLTRHPEHRLRHAAERLCDVLGRLREPRVTDPAGEVAFLEAQLEPLARDFLGSRARDFLAPFWRRAAQALERRPFDRDQDHIHASWAYARCLDWPAVLHSIEQTPDAGAQPVLMGRMAEALRHLGRRHEAIGHWCSLCWQAPEHAAQLLNEASFPDATIVRAWNAWQDAELDGGPEWLPAWLLLQEPGLARALPRSADASAPQRGFTILQRLLGGKPGDRGDHDQVALRRALQQEHAGLFDHYLIWLDGP